MPQLQNPERIDSAMLWEVMRSFFQNYDSYQLTLSPVIWGFGPVILPRPHRFLSIITRTRISVWFTTNTGTACFRVTHSNCHTTIAMTGTGAGIRGRVSILLSGMSPIGSLTLRQSYQTPSPLTMQSATLKSLL